MYSVLVRCSWVINSALITEGIRKRQILLVCSSIRKDTEHFYKAVDCSCTIDGKVKLPCGLSSDVAGHTGVLSFVAELSHVDLQVAATGQNTHAGRGLHKDKR